ncbi:unnamed protein product, partial [Didymodactylos carnosus]
DKPGKLEVLFLGDKVAVDKHTMEGEFGTLNSGMLTIEVKNEQGRAERTVWFRVKQTSLSKSHLFEGIFNIIYSSSCGAHGRLVSEKDMATVLERVFHFTDSLLDGQMKLKDMVDLKAIFCNRNINVRDEVKKLFSHRFKANNQQGEKFNIISNENADQTIDAIKNLSDENCSLKDITENYRNLKQRFRNLTTQHLQLIKTASECPNVIQMMERAELHTTHGRRRFQELRDNLTTQFQLQERNNMILNSWIIIYGLCKPFTMKVQTLEEFVDIAKLPYFEDIPVTHMQIINDNIQLVNMWLSADETNVLDNALITMEYLSRSGVVHIHLRRLINEESKFEIEYSIDKPQTLIKDDLENPIDENAEPEKIKFILTKSEVDDHKRQLTFCNANLSEEMKSKKILLNEQLKLLTTVNNIYLKMIQLEMAGHPDYQLKQETLQLSDRTGEISRILSRMKDNQNEEIGILKRLVERQTDQLRLIHQQMEISYKLCLQHLDEYRTLTRLLQLFSNRQLMILIILLTKSTPDNRMKWNFLKKLHLKTDMNFTDDRELQLTIQSLGHYLRSLRLSDCDISVVNIQRLYDKHKIPSRSTGEYCLQKLSAFLKELLNDGKELFVERTLINGNQQYLVTLTHIDQPAEPNPLDHDLDMEIFSILVNILNPRLPSSFQIL